MRIEHVALWVSDLEQMRAFYCERFGGEASARYLNPRTQFESYFIRFEGGARLELMRRPDVEGRAEGPRQGWAHLAFTLGSEAEVDARTARLAAAGLEVVSGPRRTGDGYYESCVLDPEGNAVELLA